MLCLPTRKKKLRKRKIVNKVHLWFIIKKYEKKKSNIINTIFKLVHFKLFNLYIKEEKYMK